MGTLMTHQLLTLPELLAEVGHGPEKGAGVYQGADGQPYVLPVTAPEGSPFIRLTVYVAGRLDLAGMGGGWAALVVPETPDCSLGGPLRIWTGRDDAARNLDRLDAQALLAALSGLSSEPGSVIVRLNRNLCDTGGDMNARLGKWRRQGWLGDRWERIPNVDLWRDIDRHAEELSVSWWPNLGGRPGAWQEIAQALATNALVAREVAA